MPRKKETATEGEMPEGEAALSRGRVVDALREAILGGRLAPGSRLRQEELAETYGISRIPVREALHQLESEGLVVLKPNSGAWIARLDQAECVEIYKIRERLEPLAILESAARMPAEVTARLRALAARIAATKDIEEFLALDRDFHLLSYSAAAMPRLLTIIETYWNSTQHYRRAFTLGVDATGMTTVHHEHALIVEALERRDGEQAGMILKGHIRRTRLELQARPEVFD
ncbi:GntR family transcriptional regulator [Ensifer soli]|uniref:GntR family transcriptional regulator n=1 Tax=Ciceribacter sp. sgz301302 TaxID=3342379 RepID=UPI0035B77421